MVIEKFSTREQFLIFLVAATLVLGGYGLFRFAPQHKAIAEQKSLLIANQNKIKNPDQIEEPIDDVGDLKDDVLKLEKELAELNAALERSERKLAPVNNPVEVQDVVQKINDVARSSGFKVVDSQPYIVQKKDGSSNQIKTPVLDSKRAQRKVDRALRRKIAKEGNSNVLGEVKISIPKEGELTYQLVNSLKTPRPFQQIRLQGHFADLMRFIHTINTFSYQITIIKIDISATNQTQPPGVAQPLNVTVLLAL
jgi:Tfp pilus assembly protein PilO